MCSSHQLKEITLLLFFLDLTVIFKPVLHVFLSCFHLAQRMVTGYFPPKYWEQRRCGAQGVREAEAELHSWGTGKSGPQVKLVVFCAECGQRGFSLLELGTRGLI